MQIDDCSIFSKTSTVPKKLFFIHYYHSASVLPAKLKSTGPSLDFKFDSTFWNVGRKGSISRNSFLFSTIVRFEAEIKE